MSELKIGSAALLGTSQLNFVFTSTNIHRSEHGYAAPRTCILLTCRTSRNTISRNDASSIPLFSGHAVLSALLPKLFLDFIPGLAMIQSMHFKDFSSFSSSDNVITSIT